MALGKLGVLVNFINQQYKVCKIAHFVRILHERKSERIKVHVF